MLLRSGLLVVLLLSLTKAAEAGPQTGKLPPGFVPASEGAATQQDGMPGRIRHEATDIVLIRIRAGELLMGSPKGEHGRSPGERQHRRVIRKAFYLGETEVTLGQFRRFAVTTQFQSDAEKGVEENGNFKGAFATTPAGDRDWHPDTSWHRPYPNLPTEKSRDDHPVMQVSWNDAQAFCKQYGFRLPSEAEWEHACRAGSTGRYPWGDNAAGGDGYLNAADRRSQRRFPSRNLVFPFDDGFEVLAPVGQFKPNAWGLKDMLGNVQEWCGDLAGDYPAEGAAETPATRLSTHGESSARVVRGSSWLDHPDSSRCAARFGMLPTSRRDFIGFRVAWSIEP